MRNVTWKLGLLVAVGVVGCGDNGVPPAADLLAGAMIDFGRVPDLALLPIDFGPEFDDMSVPLDLSVAPDLSIATDDGSAPMPDTATPPDAAVPPDLAPAPDLLPPADLTPLIDLTLPPDLMPSCTNGSRDGNETDVDCGGSCPRCPSGKTCALGSDCQHNVCVAGVCSSPSCSDGVRNGSESDTDCGGGACPRCATGKTCGAGSDCGTSVCKLNLCIADSCSDGVKNGNETDIDCGGSCPQCAAGKSCNAAIDCQTGVCTSNLCQAPSCSDGVKNGKETDVDCGATCPKCATGSHCTADGDCVSTYCAASICTTASCSDGKKNGSETDVDCGGPTCPTCGSGKVCAANKDCTGNMCTNGTCACPAGTFGNDCHYPKTCNELHTLAPTVASGLATVNPDGPGGQAPFQVYCDMTMLGGGWTRLVRHVAAAGYFGNDTLGRASNVLDPTHPLYSILGKVDLFRRGDGTYEFLYWNKQYNKYVRTTQPWSPLDQSTLGKCPAGFAKLDANYAPELLCGYTPGPVGWSVINGFGPNWTHSAGQLMIYSNWPLVCTHNDGYQCNSIEFYVR